ncbi:MAG TPA: cupin domain-containing protein [Vicinamibacterales bacterium]|jgi:quercetin dioxygenase-like cupin family protein
MLIVCALLGLAAVTASAQDPVAVAPNQCKVVLENDYVRVLRWAEAPGDKVPMHEHPALVSISLSANKTRFTSADGKAREGDAKAGQATWSDPERHSSQNLSAKAGEVIQVELKTKPGAAMTALPASEDSVAVDPKHYKVVLQNDRVRVLRIHYAPNEKSVMHTHPASVAVFLTDGQTTFTLGDGTTTTADVKPGQVLWNDNQKHLPQNTGGKPFELILVELR